MKPKLTFSQLYENLESKGITFNYHDKNEAIEIMKNRNYYYRLTSYRKNYDMFEGKYINLDFKALVDISSIGTYLREFLLQLCLDIEHLAKTKIMSLITENINEDGYSIIHQLEQVDEKKYDNVIRYMSLSKYKKTLNEKRKNNISIWVFLEFAGINETNLLIDLYSAQYRNSIIKTLSKHLTYVQQIRNNCAHNNTYLLNIFDSESIIVRPTQQVKKMAASLGINEYWVHYMKIHDLIVLFYLHKLLASSKLRERRKENGKKLIKRSLQNKEFHHIKIKGYFAILDQMLDSLI